MTEYSHSLLVLFSIGFRHCQELKESRDVIVSLLTQFQDLSGNSSLQH